MAHGIATASGGAATTDDRRRYRRLAVPSLVVRFDDRDWLARDWSLGGVSIEDYSGSRIPGALLTVVGLGASGGALSSVSIRARVARADLPVGRLSIAFLGLDEPAYALLSTLMENAAAGNWPWPD